MKPSTPTTAIIASLATALAVAATQVNAQEAQQEPDAITKQEQAVSCLRNEAVKIAKKKAKHDAEVAKEVRNAGSAEQLIDNLIKQGGPTLTALMVAANNPQAVEKCAALGPQPPKP